MIRIFILLINLASGLLACAPIFPKDTLKEVDPELSFPVLIKEPEKYAGKMVILGGKIIKIELREGKTWLEILQQPLNWQNKPKETDESGGRFLAFFADFRDPAIYSPGRKITIVGQVKGKETMLIQEKKYQYPVLEVKDARLWGKEAFSGLIFHFGIGLGGTF